MGRWVRDRDVGEVVLSYCVDCVGVFFSTPEGSAWALLDGVEEGKGGKGVVGGLRSWELTKGEMEHLQTAMVKAQMETPLMMLRTR